MKSGNRGIRQEIIEPNCVESEIEVTTQNSCSPKRIGDTASHALEIIETLDGLPGWGVVNTNKQNIHIRKDEQNTNDSARYYANGEAQKAS